MNKQVSGVRYQVSGKKFQHLAFFSNLEPGTYNLEPRTNNLKPRTYNPHAGFTLVETLVAISMLMIAIVAPMTLTTQSLASAYYARDQITAFYLAQEAIESVRHRRDDNVLKVALGYQGVNLLDGLPPDFSTNPFTVDATNNDAMVSCGGNPCQRLRKSTTAPTAGLYGYNGAWTPTYFTRSVRATFVPGSNNDEINILATVTWQTGSFQSRSFSISENLYRWIQDGSALP